MVVAEVIWRRSTLGPQESVQRAINILKEPGLGIALVLSEDGNLLGTVTDGDVRRGVLKGYSQDSSVDEIMCTNPLVVSSEMREDFVMQLMSINNVYQVPVVNSERRLVGCHVLNRVGIVSPHESIMFIMAGGQGKRMLPHTAECPKPMLLVDGKPIIERIIEKAVAEGFRRFVIAIQYLGHMIEDYFGDGNRFGIYIEYLREATPLGTAGSLALLSPRPEHPFIVTNGDVLSDISFGDLLQFHNFLPATATMVLRQHEWQHPFGVVQTRGLDIVGFEEKPVSRTYINAGIYALSPEALGLMELGGHCDMPALFEKIGQRGGRTVAYPIHEQWLDIGRPEDLRIANSMRRI